MSVHPFILAVVCALLGAVGALLCSFALYRQGEQNKAAITGQIEALRRSVGGDWRAAVAILGARIDAGARAPVSRRGRPPAERFREASRVVRLLAKSVARGADQSPEAEAIKRQALEELGIISGTDAASYLGAIVARADSVTLDWLADELAVRPPLHPDQRARSFRSRLPRVPFPSQA
jgi:hypothetical protein